MGDLELSFDFFGVRCAIQLPTAKDCEHFRYYFNDFLDQGSGSPDLEFALEVENEGCTFIEALQRADTTKRIRIRRDGEPWCLYEEFTETSRRPSPIPPFHLTPLDERLLLFHAGCVQDPASRRLIAFAGPSWSGKSTLTLAMAQHGFGVVTDDIVVFDRKRRCVVPFCRPIGIRERTREVLPWLQDLPGLEAGVRFATDRGTTIMVRMSDLLPTAIGQEGTLAAVYLLEPTDVDALEIEPLQGAEGFDRLRAFAYAASPRAEVDAELRARLTDDVHYHRVRYVLERDAASLARTIARGRHEV